MARAQRASEEPAGLVYRRDFITADEERSLVEWATGIDFREVVLRGQTSRRTVRQYGIEYEYAARGRLAPGEPLPADLTWLRDRCAGLAGLSPEAFVQALVSRYPAGAPIGWHRDAPAFGAKIVGVSLLAASRMRFRRGAGDERRVWELDLEPRSAYVLGGEARSAWEHSIPPVRSLRYSITFRTLV